MGRKIKEVTIYHEKLGKRTFKKEHAERILTMQNNGGWILPTDSKFKLGENGIIRKANTGTAESTSE